MSVSLSELFGALVAAAEQVRQLAEEIYRCAVYATPKGQYDKTERKHHEHLHCRHLDALHQAADAALSAAHKAGISFDAAELRIKNLVGVCHEWLTWSWQRRGKGAWHHRGSEEGEEEYLERITGCALRPASRVLEAERLALDSAFVEKRGACIRMGQVATEPPPDTAHYHYVDLDQIAAVVNRSKSALEKLKRRKNNPLPNPDVPGGGGKKAEWLWSRIRPWLETEFKKHFAETLPRRL